MTMNQRLTAAGIRTIRTGAIGRFGREVVYLERDGKRIVRPHVGNCAAACRKAFGVEL